MTWERGATLAVMDEPSYGMFDFTRRVPPSAIAEFARELIESDDDQVQPEVEAPDDQDRHE